MARTGQGDFRGDGELKNAIVLDVKDIKKLIAEKYGVPETAIIKSAYSYTVVTENGEVEEDENAE